MTLGDRRNSFLDERFWEGRGPLPPKKLLVHERSARMLQSILHPATDQPFMCGNDDSDEGRQLDVETGFPRRSRKGKRSGLSSNLQAFCHRLQQGHIPQPYALMIGFLALGISILFIIAVYDHLMDPRMSNKLLARAPQTYPYEALYNLVMVAGHAIYTSNGCQKANGEASWFLEKYQKHPGQAATFVEHIKVGVETAATDRNALLLFSGGETRRGAGPRSEAQSYWTVAEVNDWFGEKQDVRWRALTEEYARDSFENLLFSICRFRGLTGKYPHNITVVSYDFKENRFSNLHRISLRFPSHRFFFKGTPSSPASTVAALEGEEAVQEQFQQDPYGCVGSLRLKRLARDPFLRVVPYPYGCPELEELFGYCGTTIYGGNLPWDNSLL